MRRHAFFLGLASFLAGLFSYIGRTLSNLLSVGGALRGGVDDDLQAYAVPLILVVGGILAMIGTAPIRKDR